MLQVAETGVVLLSWSGFVYKHDEVISGVSFGQCGDNARSGRDHFWVWTEALSQHTALVSCAVLNVQAWGLVAEFCHEVLIASKASDAHSCWVLGIEFLGLMLICAESLGLSAWNGCKTFVCWAAVSNYWAQYTASGVEHVELHSRSLFLNTVCNIMQQGLISASTGSLGWHKQEQIWCCCFTAGNGSAKRDGNATVQLGTSWVGEGPLDQHQVPCSLGTRHCPGCLSGDCQQAECNPWSQGGQPFGHLQALLSSAFGAGGKERHDAEEGAEPGCCAVGSVQLFFMWRK